MSLTPENAPPREFKGSLVEPEAPPPPLPGGRWQNRLLRICFAIFTFEVGIFLVIFPWMGNWNSNYFQGLIPALRDFWSDPYFRGALTGLGFVNLYIACLEVVRLLRRT
jgi:hypothetical protein